MKTCRQIFGILVSLVFILHVVLTLDLQQPKVAAGHPACHGQYRTANGYPRPVCSNVHPRPAPRSAGSRSNTRQGSGSDSDNSSGSGSGTNSSSGSTTNSGTGTSTIYGTNTTGTVTVPGNIPNNTYSTYVPGTVTNSSAVINPVSGTNTGDASGSSSLIHGANRGAWRSSPVAGRNPSLRQFL